MAKVHVLVVSRDKVRTQENGDNPRVNDYIPLPSPQTKLARKDI